MRCAVSVKCRLQLTFKLFACSDSTISPIQVYDESERSIVDTAAAWSTMALDT